MKYLLSLFDLDVVFDFFVCQASSATGLNAKPGFNFRKGIECE